MKDIIASYRLQNHYLALLKELIPKYNDKALGTRFCNYLQKYDIQYMWKGYYTVFNAQKLDFLVLYSSEFPKFMQNNKLNAKGLIEIIDAKLKNNTEHIQKLEQEEQDKDKILKKYDTLITELDKLIKDLSQDFKKKYNIKGDV